jgi:hypothetical protein
MTAITQPSQRGNPKAKSPALSPVVCEGGWLTALDVGTGQYWQANERGEVREGKLGRPSRGREPGTRRGTPDGR